MPSGGARKGAGRKKLENRPTKDKVRLAATEIDNAQPLAVKTLVEALKATVSIPHIIGRDEKGRPEYEYVEKPDHQARTRASVALLNKRIPDLARQEMTGKDGEKLDVGIIYYPGQKKQPGAT